MVIPTDVQVSFVMASMFADMGRRQIESGSHQARGFVTLWGMLNPALFLGPTIVVFFSGWPAWEIQYWTSLAERVPGNPYLALVAGLYMMALVLAALLGSRLGCCWIAAGRVKLLRVVYLAVLAVTAGIFLLQWPAPVVLGTVAEFRAAPDAMPYIWQDATFFTMYCALLLWCAAPFAFVFFGLRRRHGS